jgi:hypothetical protein
MYRILGDVGEVSERRRQATHPALVKPELVAAVPNAVWSWDITKLLGPVKWTYYYLYVIIDIYSRYVPGWMLARAERAHLAERLLADTIGQQAVSRGRLTIHADRGSSMASKPVALLLGDLGVTKSHSRPHVSNDNPYSESQFKTLKYRPEFPKRFGSFEDAHAFARSFFDWMLLPMSSHRFGDSEIGSDGLVDLPCDESFEAANDLPFGTSFGGATSCVDLGVWIPTKPTHRDSPECGVRLAVPAAVETVSCGLAARGRDRCRAA